MAESVHEEHCHSRERPVCAALSNCVACEKDMRIEEAHEEELVAKKKKPKSLCAVSARQ